MNLLVELIPILFLLGSFTGLWVLACRYPNKKWLTWLIQPATVFIFLIGWTLLGFLNNLDYTQTWGCIIATESIFSTGNIVYSGTALGLLSIGFFYQSRYIGTVILICELLFWLYKLYWIKGGYVVGFGGIPLTSVVMFDTVALTLRLTLIKQTSQINIKIIFVSIAALIIMVLKVQFFR